MVQNGRGERGAARDEGVGEGDGSSTPALGELPSPVLEDRLGHLLAAGVVVSTALFAAGLAIDLLAHGALSTVLLHAGLIVLMATPVARVVVSVVEYVRERDWFFAAMTLAVLAVLVTTLVVAVSMAL